MTMNRRTALGAAIAAGGLQLSGCTTPLPKPLDDRYCYRANSRIGSRSTCTPGPAPDAAADAQAKRFEAVPGSLVIYVVRNRWGDTVNLVNLSIDGGDSVATAPASLVRLVVAPGTHRLAFDWNKGRGDLEIRGAAGQVVFVDLIGSLWIWSQSYRLEMGELPSSRDRALRSRLVANVEVKGRP